MHAASFCATISMTTRRLKRLYDKAQWRRLREQVLRMQPLCVLCLQRGLAVPSEQVDHITPIADGGEPWAFSNLRGLCASDHSRVTAAAKTGRDVVIGVNPITGYPIKASST